MAYSDIGHLQKCTYLDEETSRFVRINVWAFTATIIVLTDINTAPKAGGIMKPKGAKIPAANGIMMML